MKNVNDILIRTQNITKFYNKEKVLDNISIDIPENKVTALIGPNGAGKTTLIKILLSLINYTSGKIIFRRQIRFAYAPEECNLYPELTVGYFLKWLKKIKNVSFEKMRDYINKFEFNNCLNKKIKFLSKGYKRRLIVVQALIGNEDFVILDEPSDGLDIEFKFKLHNILKSVLNTKTVLICSHESLILSNLANKIVILDNGKKIFEGNAEKLKTADGKLYIEDIYLRVKDEKYIINK